jgi:hypothetical protein
MMHLYDLSVSDAEIFDSKTFFDGIKDNFMSGFPDAK